MKKFFFFLLVVIVICMIALLNKYAYPLCMLKNRAMTFNELPSEVQILIERSTKEGSRQDILYVNMADTSYYKAEEVYSPIGPPSLWILCVTLDDKRKSQRYIVNRYSPTPYFILKNRLYIPKEYNIVGGGELFRDIKYTEYDLK